MVKALHRAGIEVILDVVYNHTAEGNHLGSDALVPRHRQRVVLPPVARGPALLRRLHRHRQQPQPGAPERAAAHHGLAAVLRGRVPRRRLPLRPRVGARARVPRGEPPLGVLRHHLPGPGAVAGEADRRAVGRRRRRLPGRQLPGAVDASGTARTATPCATTGAASAPVGDFATRFAGSADLYERDGRRPFASINFVTAHDGFTLADLVSYNEKHNEANLEDNADGTDDNRSWNCGVEGPTDDPEVLELRGAPATQLPHHVAAVAGRADAARRRRDRAGARTATTTRTARTTRSPGSTGTSTTRDEALLDVHPAAGRVPRATTPSCGATTFFGGEPDERGLPDIWWFRPDGRRMARRDWAVPGGPVGDVPQRRRDPVGRRRRASRCTTTRCSCCSTPATRPSTFVLPPRRFGAAVALELSTADPDASPQARSARAQVGAASRRARVRRAEPPSMTPLVATYRLQLGPDARRSPTRARSCRTSATSA